MDFLRDEKRDDLSESMSSVRCRVTSVSRAGQSGEESSVLSLFLVSNAVGVLLPAEACEGLGGREGGGNRKSVGKASDGCRMMG